MRGSILGRTAFAAAVALALGVGVRDVAASGTAQARPYCSDDLHCEEICQRLYPGQDVAGFCSDGNTCYCYR